ncbi:MAG: ABC transporter permease [Rhodoblastus sp.]
MTDAALDAASQATPASRTRPFAPFEWTLALRYLRARRARGLVSVIAGFSFLGIMLGVATLIVVMSVMNGFHKELLDKIVGVNGHIFVQAADAPMKDYDEMTERIRKVKGVAMALPMIEGAAGVSSQFGQTGALARGVREADLEKLPGVAGNIKNGEIFGFDRVDEDHPASVVIGRRMADKLSVRVGDTISILTARGAQTPFGVAPRIKAYPVRAIFSMGMAEFDGVFVYMPLSEAQAYLQPRRRGLRHRGLPRQCREDRRDAAEDPGGGGPSRHPHRLAAGERDLLQRAQGRAQRHVHHPDADRAGGRAQHHLRPHHARARQERTTSPSCARWARRNIRSCASSSSPARRSASRA